MSQNNDKTTDREEERAQLQQVKERLTKVERRLTFVELQQKLYQREK